MLGLLACSKGGLSETELQYLLSDDLTESVPMVMWAEVRRTLKPFLRNIGGRGEEERLEFFHASIQEVCYPVCNYSEIVERFLCFAAITLLIQEFLFLVPILFLTPPPPPSRPPPPPPSSSSSSSSS